MHLKNATFAYLYDHRIRLINGNHLQRHALLSVLRMHVNRVFGDLLLWLRKTMQRKSKWIFIMHRSHSTISFSRTNHESDVAADAIATADCRPLPYRFPLLAIISHFSSFSPCICTRVPMPTENRTTLENCNKAILDRDWLRICSTNASTAYVKQELKRIIAPSDFCFLFSTPFLFRKRANAHTLFSPPVISHIWRCGIYIYLHPARTRVFHKSKNTRIFKS